MNHKYKLTIAIPTYNRPKQLAHTLSIVLPQAVSHEDVQLLVLDNCSPVPAKQVMDEVAQGAALPERVKVIRHPYNIGGDPNILRCFELAEGDWLWCLGDDDEPAKDAVETILSDISCGVHCYAYYGLSSTFPLLNDIPDGKLIGTDIGDWARRTPSYAHRLFISESVYRLSAIMPYISQGYKASVIGSGHLAMAYLAIEAGGKYLLSSKQIAAYKQPDRRELWDPLPFAFSALSIMSLVNGKTNYENFKTFFSTILLTSPLFLLWRMFITLSNFPKHEIRKYYSLLASVLCRSFIADPQAWLIWRLGCILAMMPDMFCRLYGSRHLK